MQKKSLSTKDAPIEVRYRISRKEKHRARLKPFIFKHLFKIFEWILAIIRLYVAIRDFLK